MAIILFTPFSVINCDRDHDSWFMIVISNLILYYSSSAWSSNPFWLFRIYKSVFELLSQAGIILCNLTNLNLINLLICFSFTTLMKVKRWKLICIGQRFMYLKTSYKFFTVFCYKLLFNSIPSDYLLVSLMPRPIQIYLLCGAYEIPYINFSTDSLVNSSSTLSVWGNSISY